MPPSVSVPFQKVSSRSQMTSRTGSRGPESLTDAERVESTDVMTPDAPQLNQDRLRRLADLVPKSASGEMKAPGNLHPRTAADRGIYQGNRTWQGKDRRQESLCASLTHKPARESATACPSAPKSSVTA